MNSNSQLSGLTITLACLYALVVVRTISKIYCISQKIFHPGKQPEELFTEADGNAARSNLRAKKKPVSSEGEPGIGFLFSRLGFGNRTEMGFQTFLLLLLTFEAHPFTLIDSQASTTNSHTADRE